MSVVSEQQRCDGATSELRTDFKSVSGYGLLESLLH
jgi:hypothetical protein